MNRRSFLTGLIAAPVVVRSGVLMPLRGLVMASELPRCLELITIDPAIDYVIFQDVSFARSRSFARADLVELHR